MARNSSANRWFQSTRPVRGATTSNVLTATLSKFQSTRPVRGATRGNVPTCHLVVVSIHAPRAGRDSASPASLQSFWSFNPRAPCGARLRALRPLKRSSSFNPRAPCGARHTCSRVVGKQEGFQSTCPVRGATVEVFPLHEIEVVSIHAPRAGRDIHLMIVYGGYCCFNPRAPCGARQPHIT